MVFAAGAAESERRRQMKSDWYWQPGEWWWWIAGIFTGGIGFVVYLLGWFFDLVF